MTPHVSVSISRRFTKLIFGIACVGPILAAFAADWQVLSVPSNDADGITLAGGSKNAAIVWDTNDYPVVQLAANFFADDVQRVSGYRPTVTNAPVAPQMIIVGTLGHCALVDKLAADQKLTGLDKIRGSWETTLSQLVDKPFPNVDRALVIVGSDRR